MVNLIAEYIKYRLKAKGRHGIHSPFVYDLVDQCFKIEFDPDFFQQRKSLFQELNKSSQTIEIQDFGVGSKKLGSIRSVRSIFNTASSYGIYGDLLYRLSKHYKPAKILELGTSLGIGTIHLSKGNPESKIITIDACTATQQLALKNFEQLNCNNIVAINITFTEFLENCEDQFDFIFVDGHHDGEALINYINILMKFSHEETLFILDDIRWSSSMLNAWDKLIQSEDFHVSIDLFRMGILLKRNHQVKEHFILRL